MFNPTECDIDTGKLESLRTDFQNLHDRICGRSEGYGDVTSSSANRFTDLIAGPIKDMATENQEAWSSAMMACTVAIGAVGEIIEAVEWYEEEIENIRGRFNTAVSASSNVENVTAIEALAAPFNSEAAEAWTTLEQKCEGAEDTLAAGPTPETIRALIEAGHISGDISFATTGDWEMFYFDPDDAESMVHAIEEAVANGGAGYLASLSGAGGHLAVLSQLVQRAIDAQKNGGTLHDNELEFLENMFGEFSGDDGEDDFLGFLDNLENSEHLDESLKDDLRESLSGAMLASSDESIGGGYDNVPDDVRTSIEGPDSNAVDFNVEYEGWTGGFSNLSNFFSHADNEIQGGVDFSAELTGTISRTIGYAESELGDPPLSEGEFRSMLDVSTRNVEANYAIITGVYPENDGVFEFSSTNRDVNLDSVLEAFYTHDWDDGGEVAAQLTDWIYDYGISDERSEERMSTHAAFEIISAITSEPLQEELLNTGFETEGGNTNASFTEINEHIAGSLNNLYFAHIEDFSLSTDFKDKHDERWGTPHHDLIWSSPMHNANDYAMFLDWDTRENFMQFLLANDDLAPNVLAASHAHEMEYLNLALTGADDVRTNPDGSPGWSSESLGRRAGAFNDMINGAMAQEYEDRGASQAEARQQYADNWLTAYEIVKTGVSTGVGDRGGIATDLVFQLADKPVQSGIENLAENNISDDFLDRDISNWVHEHDTELTDNVLLQALNVGIDEGFISPEDVSGQLAPPGDTDALLPQNPGEWSGDRNTKIDPMNDLLEKVDNGETGGEGGEANPLSSDVMGTIDDYTGGYERSHRSMSDLFFSLGDDDDFKAPEENSGNDEEGSEE